MEKKLVLGQGLAFFLSLACADEVLLKPMEVISRGNNLLGLTQSASQGLVGRPEFEFRPWLRIGELIEVVPGMLATQHSGDGKANQYFLRGFNLDHGTDFAAFLDGVPLNLPTHGHGQGYLDLNPLIPELIDYVEFGKGPYYADVGDFSSAGYARFHTAKRLPKGFFRQTFGSDKYFRSVAADSFDFGQSSLLVGGEAAVFDGPWDEPMDQKSFKSLVKYTFEGVGRGFTLGVNAYYGDWTATDQIPERALKQGLISRLGTIDPTDGGQSHRFGLAFNGWNDSRFGQTRLTLYSYYSDLRLYSNFTFFLDNPENGDQLFQKDRRVVSGANIDHHWHLNTFGIDHGLRLGTQLRHDFIPKVALYNTQRRRVVASTRLDEVEETAIAAYLEATSRWHEKVRTTLGLRGDGFLFNVQSRKLKANSSKTSDAKISPKFAVVLGPWHATELYFNYGFGYHSNDARGTVTRLDPKTGEPVRPVDPLVRSRGFEAGIRTYLIPGLSSTLALWQLRLDSELVFVGDAGTTEPSNESKRYGIEFSNYYRALDWLTLEFDLALTRARFLNVGTEANRIPNSVGRVITGGMILDHPSGGFGAVRVRHFGAVPLNEAGTRKAGSTTLVNLGLGWRFWQDRLGVSFDILNLTDSRDFDIAYFYASRLPGEPEGGIEDVHFHPVMPRQFRGTVQVFF
ncbi:MAG: TonB-dependent receptor [Methylohalobius sp.]